MEVFKGLLLQERAEWTLGIEGVGESILSGARRKELRQRLQTHVSAYSPVTQREDSLPSSAAVTSLQGKES